MGLPFDLLCTLHYCLSSMRKFTLHKEKRKNRSLNRRTNSKKIAGMSRQGLRHGDNWPTHGLKFLMFSLSASAWVRQWIRIQKTINLNKDVCCWIIFEHSLIFFYLSDFVVTSFLNLCTGITFFCIIYLYICALEDI